MGIAGDDESCAVARQAGPSQRGACDARRNLRLVHRRLRHSRFERRESITRRTQRVAGFARKNRLVAVGTLVDPAPPAQIRTCRITAYGSYLGYLASKRRSYLLLYAHRASRSTRWSGSASGARSPARCSPWSVAFPPCPPPVACYRCSGTSSVLRDRPTPHRRARWTSGSRPSPTGPSHLPRRASMGSPGSCAWSFHTCLGSQTARSPADAGEWRIRRCCLPPCGTTSALRSRLFRSSIPSLHVPLSTLRRQPCGSPRMTRGQDGSLLLSCVTLSFTTPRRFIPAHSATLYVDDLVEGSELVERQTGAPLGARSRLAARVATTPIALSPNGCKGKKSRIARRGKPR